MTFFYTLRQWAEITGGKIISGNPDFEIREILTDSRDYVPYSEGVMFAALKTSANDGHRYIPDLIKSGVRAFLIDRASIAENTFSESNLHFLCVEDVLSALQKMASFHRSRLSSSVIAITGSNGKTTVKEWLSELLHPYVRLYRSPGSFNSQLGVPLSVLNVCKDYEYCIFEAGISQKGEMQNLQKILCPDTGILTWFGEAHREGFSDEREKWIEKNLLFLSCSRVLIHIPADALYLLKNVNYTDKEIRIISESREADYLYNTEEAIQKGILLVHYQNEKIAEMKIAFRDEASIRNAVTCLCFIHWIFPEYFTKTREQVSSLKRIHTRLDIVRGIQNSLLINDYYTSDPDSLKIAIRMMMRQAGIQAKKILILTEFEESGLTEQEMQRHLTDLIQPIQPFKVFLIGERIYKSGLRWPDYFCLYENTQTFLEDGVAWKQHITDAVILIKGARRYALEQVSRELIHKNHQTVLEIYPNRIRHNIQYFRSLLRPGVKIMAMIKAMGYGTGATEIARFLQQSGIDYLAVAFADEGVELRKAGIHLPVMVMNPEEDGWLTCIQYRMEPVVYSFSCLEKLGKFSYLFSESRPVRIHIEIDTGMKRLGFAPDEIPELINKLKSQPSIKIQSVFSHFVGAEDSSSDRFSEGQWKTLCDAANTLKKELNTDFIVHICNTAGTLRFPHAHADMVRLGIGLYGIVPKVYREKTWFALRWVTSVSQIHKLKPGESVGYSRKYVSPKSGQSITLPVGYADGFLRIFGNGNACVKIQGKKFRTLGNICMDMCMAEGGKEGEIKENAEVVIFDSVEDLEELSRIAGTIPYEIISLISSRVKRVYIYD